MSVALTDTDYALPPKRTPFKVLDLHLSPQKQDHLINLKHLKVQRFHEATIYDVATLKAQAQKFFRLLEEMLQKPAKKRQSIQSLL